VGFPGRLGHPGNMPTHGHGCGVGFFDFDTIFYPWIGGLGGFRNCRQHLRILKERGRSIDSIDPVVFPF